MGVRINGVWHEELPDPGTGGADSGNGRSFTSAGAYNAVASGSQAIPTTTTNPTNPTNQNNQNQNQNQNQNGTGINDADMEKLRTYFSQTSGFSIKELEEKKREFDLTRTETQRQFDTTQAESARQFNATYGLNQSKLGLDYLTTASQMGGPASVFQQADFLRGAQQRGDVPSFLSALASNTQMPAFTGAGNASIIPQTPGGLALQLGAGQTATIPTTGAAAGQVGGYSADQLAQIDAYMNQQIGNNNWAGATFHQLVGQGVPIADAIHQSAQGMGGAPMDQSRYTLPTIPQPMAAAAAPAAAPATAVAPVAGLGTDAAGYSYDQALSQIGNIFKAGPTGLQPGSLERLDPNELAVLKSGSSKLGYDYDAWLRAYQRGGIGQAASAAA